MSDSSFDPTRLREARALMTGSGEARGVGGVAAAAAFFAISALALAVIVVLSPAPWPR
jgi:hypothetical protein